MKTLVKFLFAALVMVAIGTSAFAQNTDNTTCAVTSTLLTSLDIAKNTDVAFNQVGALTIPNLDAETGIKTYCGSAATLGKFTVTGTGGATVKVTYDATVQLTNGGVLLNGELKFTPSVYQVATTGATFGGTAIASGGTYLINTSTSSAVAGTDFIVVGGKVTDPDGSSAIPALGTVQNTTGSLKTGDYTGTFHITVLYN